MSFLGLHLLDWIVIIFYFALMVLIGKWAQRKVKNAKDFYQGGRSFGKVLTTFMNFGNITSADQATGVTREIYRQGLSGLWFQNLVLLITPFYWFSAVLQKRTRYLGPGDIYLHRFESRFLAGLYAVYILLIAVYGGAMGYLLTGKTMQALMVKPAAEYTEVEQRSVADFNRLQSLTQKRTTAPLTVEEKSELSLLMEKQKRGELHAYHSYLNLTLFLLIYAFCVGSYTVLGGMFAAAINDVIQGLLIILLSFILIPVGLIRLGGFSGLHAKVPDYMFELFGSAATSEYTWYFVITMAFINLIGLPPRSFVIGGAAKDDLSARVGLLAGSFSKRLMMIGWALTGLIAVGLYQGLVDDPTMIWGHLTRDLLGKGMIGLMIASIMAANMSTISAQSLEWGAAFSNNILLPLRPATSQKAQVLAGRLVIMVILFASIFFALRVNDIFVMFKYVLSVGTIIGPALWLVYFWRRLTTRAVVIQMLVSILITVVIPNVAPTFDSVRKNPALTIQTRERVAVLQTRALESDVAAGRADRVGEMIEKRHVQPPSAVFFDEVVRENPDDPNSPLVGKGAFRNQLYYLSLLGLPVADLSKAQLATFSFIFDIILPFLLLFGISLLTRKNSEKVLNEFYAAVHTPTVADQQEDQRLLNEAIAHPEQVEKRKLFPGTQWEFWKPTKLDIWGFVLCWALVALIILLYIVIMKIGA
ncbi:MAG TPA: sodium:solute symporter family protein [bacterium]|nr:sodium:solute symporter family protein [bacterium]